MAKFQLAITLGIVGVVAGVVIGEFFPELFSSGFFGDLGNAVSEPFSKYRNELALKYGLFGLGIGAAVGIVMALLKKKKR